MLTHSPTHSLIHSFTVVMFRLIWIAAFLSTVGFSARASDDPALLTPPLTPPLTRSISMCNTRVIPPECDTCRCEDGYWEAVTSPDERKSLCDEHFRCSVDYGNSEPVITWRPPGPSPAAAPHVHDDQTSGYLTTKEQICASLVDQGLVDLIFIGDSQMRHVSQAIMALLTGDYRSGGVVGSRRNHTECWYDKQLEAQCRLYYVRKLRVCNNSVMLTYAAHNNIDNLGEVGMKHFKVNMIANLHEKMKQHLKSPESVPMPVYFLLFGNHPVTPRSGSRKGVNNATVVSEHLQDMLMREAHNCSSTFSNGEDVTSNSNGVVSWPIWWISSHHRLKAFNTDESDKRVQGFNEQMRNFVEQSQSQQHSCQPRLRGFIDVYNLTAQLVHQFPKATNKLSLDYAHWGYSVNLIKAVHIFNRILGTSS